MYDVRATMFWFIFDVRGPPCAIYGTFVAKQSQKKGIATAGCTWLGPGLAGGRFKIAIRVLFTALLWPKSRTTT